MADYRVGLGWDSHRLVPGRVLRLGGVAIPFDRGLEGHSDGDVLLHAITDALCGAACLPDIGQLFPNTDPQWKDADSRRFLTEVVGLVRAAAWQLENVDAVVITEAPRLAPYLTTMRHTVATCLGVASGQVNIRGKTAESMGALGRGEGIAAEAVCLLRRETAD